MSDTSFPNLQSQLQQLQASSSQSLSSSEIAVQLIGVSNEIRDAQLQVQAQSRAEVKIQRLEGEIVRQNDDGSVRIRTDRGTIDVQPPEGQRFEPGQRVVIDIPTNRRADTATLIVRQPATSQAQPATPAPQAQNTVPPASPPPAPNSVIAPPAPGQSLETPPLPKLEPGVAARLAPLNTQQTAQIQLPPIETLAQSLTQIPNFQAQIIALEAPGQQLQELLQNSLQTTAATSQSNFAALQTTPLTPSLLVAPEQPSSSVPSVLQTLQASQTLLSQTLDSPITQIAEPPILSQTNPLPSVAAQPVLRGEITQSGSLFYAPTTHTVTMGLTPEQFFAPRNFDIRFDSFSPPEVKILPPAQSTVATETLRGALPLQTQIESTHSGQPLPPKTNDAEQNTPQARPESMIVQARPGLLSAEIIGRTPEGFPAFTFPHIQTGTPPQIFAMPADVEHIQIGARVNVVPTGTQAILTALSAPVPALFTMPDSWPVMQDIYRALSQISAPQAQAMSASTPNTSSSPAQMGAAAMLFIAAVRGGDLNGWLGDKSTDLLRTSGKGALLSRLGQEAGLLSRMADAPPGEWRSISLPFFGQGEINKVILSYRQEEDREDHEQNRDKATRFVFDMSLSAMGRMQLDGLIRGQTLSMTLRSEQAFSGAAQAAMRDAYTQALEPTELSGELSFTAKPNSWVKIVAKQDGMAVST